MGIQTNAVIDINPHHLQEVLRILDLYAPDVDVLAFGSRVKWTAKAYSDLDLALMTVQPMSLENEAILREAFDECTLPFKVDIVDWASTSQKFKAIILKEGVPIRVKRNNLHNANWPVLALEETLDCLLDYRGKTPEKTSFGVPLITAKIVKNGRIEAPNEFIAREKYADWMTRGIPQAGDVVLTTEAPLGEVAQLTTSEVALAQRIVVLRGKRGVLDNNYLRYLLQTNEFQEQLAARATGTTVLGIKQSELRKIKLRLPPLTYQCLAASFLSMLDNRIMLLRETNSTLEAIAQALFKSWFVEFDPVRAKSEGRLPEGIDEASAALFPDAFEESELSLIPKGWAFQALGELLVPKRGKSITKTKCVEGDIPVVAGGLEPAYFHNQSNVSSPVVTISASGANAGFVRLYQQDIWASDCSFVSAEQTAAIYFWYVFLKFNQEKIYFMQQGAAQPHIYPSDLMRLNICSPKSDKLRNVFNSLVSPLFERIGLNAAKIQTLSELRDTLLPRLISGQLPIAEAEIELDKAIA